MEKSFIGTIVAAILALALIIGAVALAENGTPEAPALPDAQSEEKAQDEAPEEVQDEAQDEAAALREALKAYNDAKKSSSIETLEAELKIYVENGKLTQEQADLILKYYKEQQARREGVCPNCGYKYGTEDKSGRSGSGKYSGRNSDKSGKSSKSGKNGSKSGKGSGSYGFGGNGSGSYGFGGKGSGSYGFGGRSGRGSSDDKGSGEVEDGGAAEGASFLPGMNGTWGI